jgi:hypothetical protein
MLYILILYPDFYDIDKLLVTSNLLIPCPVSWTLKYEAYIAQLNLTFINKMFLCLYFPSIAFIFS